MSQESNIRAEIDLTFHDLSLEKRDMHRWEAEARHELHKIEQDPTVSLDDRNKAFRDFQRERMERRDPIDQLMRQIHELTNKLNELLATQNTPEPNANANGKNPANSGKYGEYGKRGEKGKGYSDGFVGSTKGLSGKSGGNGKKA